MTLPSPAWPTAISTKLVFRYDPGPATQPPASTNTMPCCPPARAPKSRPKSRRCANSKPKSQAFDPRGLSPAVAADRELVLAQIRGQLLALESIRMWEKNPDIYSSGATNAIFVIMSRNFAPPAERLQSAIAREKLIPRMLPVGARESQQPAARSTPKWRSSNCRGS